ncbi:MAG: 5-methyltetrahydropteroyltriglutamate--homocysteine S-methyltransferase, partial [Polaribacter sp.]
KTTILGYPRIGNHRELKKAIENYWKGKIDKKELDIISSEIRNKNWQTQNNIGIDLIPSNDFSLYDQVLDMSITLGCIPDRFTKDNLTDLDLYFAMARGLQKNDLDITALELTKWFDTNYHYLVPEFKKDQKFKLNATKIILEYKEALSLGIKTKPVIIGPLTYLLLGKEKQGNFNKMELLDSILPVYETLFQELNTLGIDYLQIDEPILSTDLSENEKIAFVKTYKQFSTNTLNFKIILANYFDCFGDNIDLALGLPVDVLHLDLVRCSSQLDDILKHHKFNPKTILSLGVVDGRNVWKNDFEKSLTYINRALDVLGEDKIWISSSCSLLHSPYDLDLETNTKNLPIEIKQWLTFAKQKLQEITVLKKLALKNTSSEIADAYKANKTVVNTKKTSTLIHNKLVGKRIANLKESDSNRISSFLTRQKKQKAALKLPLFPTTTIGSFPQTKTVRSWRSKFKKNELSQSEYDLLIKKEITETIKFQEEVGLDVFVHGEFERNDMVEYFGELLEGFAFTNFGWVQSYGTRCVKPPIIFGDVYRPNPMTIKWALFAQSISEKIVKGMLTGPVTIL